MLFYVGAERNIAVTTTQFEIENVAGDGDRETESYKAPSTETLLTDIEELEYIDNHNAIKTIEVSESEKVAATHGIGAHDADDITQEVMVRVDLNDNGAAVGDAEGDTER
jgi:hypothetical protein